jgi:hypothetical protein
VPTPSLNIVNIRTDNPNPDDQSPPTRKISLKLDSLEESSLAALKENLMLFKCLLLLYYDSNRRCSILPQLSSLLHCMQPKDPTTEVSNVVYLEIQSEGADDKATIVKLLGRLHQTFIVELGQKWLIAVGDAKLFNAIHSVKEDYGDHFNWVLPFPGDWHTL